MRTIRISLFLILFVCFVLVTDAALAQGSSQPIIILNEGNLWAWDGPGKGLQQMTNWGYNQEPVMSPDGKQVAYMAWSPITVAALQREGAVGGGEVPGDIKVFDVVSQQETIIAAQPPEASFFTQGVMDKAVIRSRPVWSPDGERLAWTEYDYPGAGLNRVMIYDFSTGVAQPVALNLPPQAGVPVPMEIAWGGSGLILRNTAVNPQDAARFDDSFLVYQTDGTLRLTIPVAQDESRFMTDFILLTYEDAEYIGVQYNTGEWDLFNPATGESQPAPGVPELYCLTAPQESISVTVTPEADGDGLEYQLLGIDGKPIGRPVDIGADFKGRVALSPDGGALAYVRYDPQASQYESAVTIWNNGEVSARFEVNPLGFSFLWGPEAWRIRSDKQAYH